MSFRATFSLFMSAVYIVAGAVLLFTDVLIDLIPRYRAALGGVLLGYGLLRAGMWLGRNRKRSTSAP